MGQYQQWLFAQEVARHLKVERETLETELLYLLDRITIMEQTVPEAENVILQALQTYFQLHTGEKEDQAEMQPDWSGLPKLGTPEVQAEASHVPGLFSPMAGRGDMLAFFDKHRQTDPRLAAWPAQAGMEASEYAGDEETRRLNENIQRWFIRWHRQLATTERPEGGQHE